MRCFLTTSSVSLAAIALFAAGPASASSNLLDNPTFQNNGAGWTVMYAQSGSDFNFSGVLANFGSVGAYDDVISQTLATTPGQLYTISFNLIHYYSDVANDFSASFGGNTIYSLTNAGYFNTTLVTETAAATSTSTVLAFAGREVPNWYSLSNPSVSAVPDPIAGAGLPAVLGLLGLAFLYRRQRLHSI